MGLRRVRFVLLGPVVVAVALATACGDETASPAPLGGRTPRDAGSGATDLTLEASIVDAPNATTYRGTLAATSPTTFGGSYADASHCTYTVTMKDVSVEALVENDELVASTVHDTMVEATVGTCPYPPQPQNVQTYVLASAVRSTSGGFRAEYLGSSGNTPKGSLIVELARTSTGFTAAATWHRTDIGKPFDWTVSGSVPISQE